MFSLDLGVKNFTRTDVSLNLVRKSIFETLKVLKIKKDIEVSVVFVGEKRMKDLNFRYRGKDKVTDVLSFSFSDDFLNINSNLGEVVICLQVAKKQSKEKGVKIQKEIALLVAHGIIHLCGINHEKSIKESKETDRIQNIVLNKIFN